MIGFQIPEATARVLSAIDVPGDREANLHITVLNLGDDVPVTTIAKMMVAVYTVASTVRPFTARTSLVSSFPGDEVIPVIAKVESDEIHELWARLREVFDQTKLNYSKRFPKYSPHVTLSWSDESVEDFRIPTVEWGAHELCLWGGNSGDGRILVQIPFSISDRAASTRLTENRLIAILQRERLTRKFKAVRQHGRP